MKKNRVYKYFFCILLPVVLILLDQVTKEIATLHLQGKKAFVLIDNILEFSYLEGGNKGAAWGIFSGKTMYFIAITTIVCVLLIVLIIRLDKLIYNTEIITKTKFKYSILQICILILFSGAIGNLIDRINSGAVVDFIYFKLINFPIFNVADIYVTCSAIAILIINIFFIDEDEFNTIFSTKTKSKDTAR